MRRPFFSGHYDPSFSLDLCLKDLGLIKELGKQVQAELPVTDAAQHAFAMAASRYGPQAAELHVGRNPHSKFARVGDQNWSEHTDGSNQHGLQSVPIVYGLTAQFIASETVGNIRCA